MTLTRLRALCMSLPGATEQIQWGKDLVFKVGGKMFCVSCTDLDPSHDVVASFKCDDETFAALVEREDIIPAPYLARARWVGLKRFDALADGEYRELIPRAHAIVSATLPKKVQAQLAAIGRKAVASAGARSARTARAGLASTSRRKRA
jgi:predicted DNA-binding protein (MmcQ/YjbR family)